MRKAETMHAGSAGMIVAAFETGTSMADLAREFGVSRDFVESLIRRVMVRRQMVTK